MKPSKLSFFFCLAFLFVRAISYAESFSGSFAWDDYSEHSHGFSTTQDGDVTLTLTTGADLNINGYVVVRDTDGSTLYSNSQGPNSTVTHVIERLRAGSYTVAVQKDGRSFYFGDYSGSTTLTANSVDNDAENNETIDDANSLQLGITETGHLGYRGQAVATDMIDWYVITTDGYGDLNVQVTTSGGGSIRDADGDLNLNGGVYIFDSNKTTSFVWTSQGPGSDVTYVVNNLRPGTYYIGLEKDSRSFYWGSYTVEATSVPLSRNSDVEPNDSTVDANSILVGQTVTGNLGARGQDQGTDMDDYWVLNHTGNGDLVFSVRTSGSEDAGDLGDGSLNLNGGVSIISAATGSSIYWVPHGPGSFAEYRHSDFDAGIYYIRVEKDSRSFYWGTYELELSQAGAPPAPVTLTVASAQGAPDPSVGMHTNAHGSSIICSVTDVAAGSTLYHCIGWSGTGSVPATGTSNAVTVVLTESATITWNWETSYLLDVNVTGGGSVDADDAFYVSGSVQTLTATPDTGWLFMGWSGDASGTGTANLTMDAPKTVMANFSDDADGDGLTNTEEAGYGSDPWKKDTDGDGFDDKTEVDHNWNPAVSDQWAVDHIAANGDTFGLYASNVVLDVALGEMALDVVGSEATLNLQLQTSDNLNVWSNAGPAQVWNWTVDGEKKFFRVRSSE